MPEIIYAVLIYTVLINLYAVIITCIDKKRASSGNSKRRIPEKSLFSAAFLGGALMMYITMRIIHHKVLHKRFMIGLPLIIILHLALISTCGYLLYKFGLQY